MQFGSSTIVGGAVLAVGVLGLYGSVTGNLTGMIAALFYPHLLAPVSGGDIPSGSGGGIDWNPFSWNIANALGL